ncbi:MAG: hypothetical protein JWQ25_674 [Daejeonella sp.]|nr:hypothetical protein [Daejeonella sp.]
MKRTISLYTVLLFLMVIASCKKDDFTYPEGEVGISKITYFPILTMAGEDIIAVPKGGTYTEAGVTAVEGTAQLEVKTSGSVNTAANGVYTLEYSAVNKDGFAASVSRTVVVYTTDATAAAHDLSGNYARNTNGSLATWTKIAPGVYTVFNPGGAPGTSLTVIAINPTGYVIDIPQQAAPSDGSSTSSAMEDYSGMPTTYKWQIVNPGYGPAVRTFVKQ